MPSFPSTPAQEQAPAPPPAPRAAPTPPAPAKSSVAPAQRQPEAASPPQVASPKSGPSVFEIITIPIGAGLVAGGITSRITDDRSTVAYVTLGAVGFTTLVMLTTVAYIAIRGTPEESASNSFQVVPVPVVVSAGRDNAGIAAGPGLFLRF
jgi:hypothetical protein